MNLAVNSAQLAATSGDDRLVVTDNAVIVLDGATAHDPAMPSAGEYVDRLATDLARLIETPDPLPDVLRSAIERTTTELHLSPGMAPSSTAVLVRADRTAVETLVLGDSSAVIGRRSGAVTVHTDERLADLHLPQAGRYRERLTAGCGYDDEHQSILRSLQAAERAQRNRPGGYWIAEADPEAARHAVHVRYARDEVSWVIAATDGVTDTLPVTYISWTEVAGMTQPQLHGLLEELRSWEAEADPDGARLPRAKRHDDKTLAVIHL
ncbi:PP2C family serine/threonine-protein phosphatase [Nocardia thailandica]